MTEKKKTSVSTAATRPAARKKGVTRKTDTSLGWVAREYPQLEDRLLALRMVEAVQSAFEGREPAPIIG